MDAAQSVPLLVWPLVLVMLLLFGGLPGSIAGQFALSDNVATSTTTIAARSADSSTTTVTSATDDSVAYVLMASPRAEGCLLIQYAGNDGDEWGQCLIPQIGQSRSALPLYEAEDGTVLLEIKNADQVLLFDEIGLAQSAIVNVRDAPLIPRLPTIVIDDKTFTAITH